MPKRLTQSSLKISKKQPTHQLNSLIKVLKPKVFITNSSNFKTLVQELTGRNNGSLSPATSSFSPPPVVSSEPAHVIQIDDHDPGLYCSPDPSFDNGFSMPLDQSSDCWSEELGLQWCQDQVMDYVNEIELRKLESWLLDIDSAACSHDVAMSTYEHDYNLSSIM